MPTSTFFIPSINMIGTGCLKDAAQYIQSYGFKHALIVTDKPLVQLGVVQKVEDMLKSIQVKATIFDGTHPNPTTANVQAALNLLQTNACDFLISLGGGSPHDCAKGVALVAANGGKIADYEGLDRSAKPQLPLISINTTAGTASEMTRFCIITDEARHIKMAIVDKHVTPILSVNDAALMAGMPPKLTAATGMDALTHAVEAYVSTAATPITDACALMAAELIGRYLRRAVANGKDEEAREQMAYAQFLAGMAFNNASLGYVHAMAHQLGGFYDLPHGVCNAVLLPHVQAFNASVVPGRLAEIGRALGVNINRLSQDGAAQACLNAIRQLSVDVGIPPNLTSLGAKQSDIPTLAANALKDACGLTNPRRANQAEIEAIFTAAM